jgi:hypothetical protein
VLNDMVSLVDVTVCERTRAGWPTIIGNGVAAHKCGVPWRTAIFERGWLCYAHEPQFTQVRFNHN